MSQEIFDNLPQYIERLIKDAARYQKLRKYCLSTELGDWQLLITEDTETGFDKAIDNLSKDNEGYSP